MKNYLKFYQIIYVLLFSLLLPTISNANEIVISDNKNSDIYTFQSYANSAEAVYKSNNYKVNKSGDNYSLFKNDKVYASGNYKSGKLKLYSIDQELFLQVKIKEDKIKLTILNEENPWEFKYKGSKIKIMDSLGDEHGKIKFYPETQKTKLKDSSGNVIVESKGFSKLSAAMAGIVITPKAKSEDIKVFTTLILLVMNK